MAGVVVVFVVVVETLPVLPVAGFLAVVVLVVVTCLVPIFVESFFWAFATPAMSKNVAKEKMNFFMIIIFSLKNDTAKLKHSFFLTSITGVLNYRLTGINMLLPDKGVINPK
jgi:hypothetical protein